MKTQCTGEQLEFHALGRRLVTSRFVGGRISSDAGGVLLWEVDERTGVTARVSECFVDHHNPTSVEHSVRELVSQRIYGIALGYEDLNDPEELRGDALLSLLVGKRDATAGDLARPQRDRLPAARTPGRAFSPWLLWLLLLPAVVHLLRRTPVVRAAAIVEPGCFGGQHRRAFTHRGLDTPPLAEDENQYPGRLGILPRVDHGVVRALGA